MELKEKLMSVLKEIDTLEKEFDKMSELLSEYDMRVNDLYHNIETNVNNINPMKLYSELKSVLNQRRVYKNNNTIKSIITSKKYNLFNIKDREELKNRLHNIPEKYNNRIYSDTMNELK